VLTLLHELIWLNQHEHEESNQFHFGEKNCILARDLKFPEFEFDLRHDSFEIVYQLHGDHLCKVWERFVLIRSSFGRFSLAPVIHLLPLPPLFVARGSSASSSDDSHAVLGAGGQEERAATLPAKGAECACDAKALMA